MKPPSVVERIIDTLAEQHPNADTELHYRNAFELLTATILSAQSTDERVNLVTPALFKRYPDARALAAATPADLEPLILSTGFFRQKAKALIGMSQKLVEAHGGTVPADMDALTALPGVGRKTANVVLGHALGVPGLPVDRHVLRVSNRIGIAEGDDPVKVEEQLCAALPRTKWTLASDVQILHGRRICRPKPLCDQCSVRDDCDYYRLVISADGGAPGGIGGPDKVRPTRGGKVRPAGGPDKVRPTKAEAVRATGKASRGAGKAGVAKAGVKKQDEARRVRTARR